MYQTQNFSFCHWFLPYYLYFLTFLKSANGNRYGSKKHLFSIKIDFHFQFQQSAITLPKNDFLHSILIQKILDLRWKNYWKYRNTSNLCNIQNCEISTAKNRKTLFDDNNCVQKNDHKTFFDWFWSYYFNHYSHYCYCCNHYNKYYC